MSNNLETKLSQLKKKYQKKYGLAVFDVDIKETKKGIIIKGIILTENRRDEILNLVKSVKARQRLVSTIKIKILSDPKQRNEIGWAAAKNKTADLKSRFVSNKIINDKILKRIRCSQIFKNEILRVLFKKEDQLLIQQRDRTIGWVDRKDVIIKRKDLYKEWKSYNFALKNKIIKKKLLWFSTGLHGHDETMEPANINKNKIVQEAEKYLGAPYLLGGKMKKGIDCSGLVQTAYWNSLGIILPKHSRDQRKFGRKIKLKNAEAGDLVFFEKLKNKTSHIGMIYDNNSSEISIIHSCRENRGVGIQELEEVLKRYKVVEVRRIVGN